jgi:hypothetical protein
MRNDGSDEVTSGDSDEHNNGHHPRSLTTTGQSHKTVSSSYGITICVFKMQIQT